MTRRIDVLTQAATQMNEPLSSEPAIYFADEVAELQDGLRLDFGQIVDHMQPHGLKEADLRHGLISFYPRGHLPDSSPATQACVYGTPFVLNERVHYPHIALGVQANDPDIRRLNNSLRHELWHLVQEYTELTYGNPRFLNTVRGLGLAAIGGATVLAGCADHVGNYGTAAGLAFEGALTATHAEELLHAFTPQEREAKRFARKHQDFTPISLVL